MLKILRFLLLILVSFFTFNCYGFDEENSNIITQEAKDREVLGWLERVKLEEEEMNFEAKLTPGSEGNVINATKIKKFKKDNSDWVKFNITDKQGVEKTLSKKISNTSTFRTTNGSLEKRYKVNLGFCLSTKYLFLEFALADRSDFEHQIRIGRDALAGHFIIDPAKTKSTIPNCKAKSLKTKKNKKQESNLEIPINKEDTASSVSEQNVIEKVESDINLENADLN